MRYFQHSVDYLRLAVWQHSVSRLLNIAGVATVVVGGSLIAVFGLMDRPSLCVGIGVTLLLAVAWLNGGFVAYRDERRLREAVAASEAPPPNAPRALGERNFHWQTAKWSCERHGVDYEFLGIDCFNKDLADLRSLSIVAKNMAVNTDGTWVERDRIGSFHETVLCACEDDFVSNSRAADIPPGGQRRWGVVFQSEHDSNARLCAADPASRNIVGRHSFNRLRLMIEAPGLVGEGVELYIELGTASTEFGINGVPQYIVVHELNFVKRADERVLRSKELDPSVGRSDL